MNVNQSDILRNGNYYKNRLKIILPFLNLKDATILDLGCGEMILYDLLQSQNKSYTGIDRFPFSNSKQFICGNIIDEELIKNQTADFIFLLGVLDHLSTEEKHSILQICQNSFHKSIIISQRNPKSILNWFHKNLSPVIVVEDYFKQNSIARLFLLKLPYSKFVFDLSKCSDWFKNLCTEKVYMISNEISAS